jgi:hypothetical protein
MTESPNSKKKIKLYSRKHVQRTTPEPTGFMVGTEFARRINGHEVTMVKLYDGTVEPLSELLVIPDRREKDGEDPLWRFYRKSRRLNERLRD